MLVQRYCLVFPCLHLMLTLRENKINIHQHGNAQQALKLILGRACTFIVNH